MYDVDRDSFHLYDYEQYRLYIDKANKNLQDKWEVAYRFLKYFDVPDMKPTSFAKIIERMEVFR